MSWVLDDKMRQNGLKSMTFLKLFKITFHYYFVIIFFHMHTLRFYKTRTSPIWIPAAITTSLKRYIGKNWHNNDIDI